MYCTWLLVIFYSHLVRIFFLSRNRVGLNVSGDAPLDRRTVTQMSTFTCIANPLSLSLFIFHIQLIMSMSGDDAFVDFAMGGGKGSFYNSTEVSESTGMLAISCSCWSETSSSRYSKSLI